MKKYYYSFLLAICCMGVFTAKAQLVNCAGFDSTLVFVHNGNQIKAYDPALPLSPTNPSVFVTTGTPMGGLAISYNLNGGAASPTFYTNSGGIYNYWDGAAYVSTGHTVSVVNPGGGVNYIYSKNGGTGEIWRYDGTGNATYLTTVSGNAGPYDLAVDQQDNFYHLVTNVTPGRILKYNSAGALIDSFVVTGNPIQTAGGGFAMIGDMVFAVFNTNPSLYSGQIIAGVVNLLPIGNMSASDLATCPSKPAKSLSVADFTISNYTICAGSCVTFTDLSTNNPTAWTWTFPNGNPATSNLQNPGTVCFNTPGVYDVKLSIVYPGGVDSTTRTLTVLPVPVATIAGDLDICMGESTTLTANPAGLAYVWSNADTAQSITITPNMTTDYTVIVNQGICADTVTATVQVYPVPVASIAGDSVLCEGESTTLTVSPAGISYAWSNASTSQSITVAPNTTTTYSVIVTQAICSDTASVNVVVWPFAVGSIIEDTLVCNGEPVQLWVSGGNGQYQWYPANTLSCEFCPDPVATSLGTTRYFAVLLDPNGCQDTLTVNVENHPPFNLVLHNGDTTIYQGDNVQLRASGAPFYYWTPTNYLTYSQSNSPLATPLEDITYTVTGVSLLQGCPQTDSFHIKVIQQDVVVPNAFSPNGDGLNDIFRVTARKFINVQEFKIFNRWGNEIFSTQDIKKGWNGTYKGVDQDPGVYYYLIRVAYPNGKTQFLRGDLTLVR
ncbi:MAG: gliding motility-associated C-terminal domain-containing protein [Bacteroidetes bacterium]|jgi:gliding motility-associated-like protein|nr:gliding motility-associated C-terminal domain-containing protein [Bacteroidota bacterium]MBK7586863.1 gliding motility-associated C-terminal domain-containing protein [Bacteroidota bacterium]MBK8330480.1 gliding motility-associated C-terminal domain-containing protein [Bacteroidota bacterium]MBK9300097.1 gliding motility-associated C-terminal domain-containing protein [Bacteroidota bacterium]MBK9481826.1 gliding motility-associated C-terminal domain-containing protein [Bacteroidota bacterium